MAERLDQKYQTLQEPTSVGDKNHPCNQHPLQSSSSYFLVNRCEQHDQDRGPDTAEAH